VTEIHVEDEGVVEETDDSAHEAAVAEGAAEVHEENAEAAAAEAEVAAEVAAAWLRRPQPGRRSPPRRLRPAPWRWRRLYRLRLR